MGLDVYLYKYDDFASYKARQDEVYEKEELIRQEIADQKGISVSDLSDKDRDNAYSLFKYWCKGQLDVDEYGEVQTGKERVEIDHSANLRISGFKDIIEETFSYHEYYPFKSMVDVVEFVPIVEGFNRKKHLPKLRSIADKYQSEKGVKITRVVRIIRAQKSDT